MPAVFYVLKKGRESGSYREMLRRLRARNACKTCAVGMGGQRGGMVNEAGHFPEVCKKSVQAQAADMGRTISEGLLRQTSLKRMAAMSSREMERLGRLAFPIIAGPEDTHFRRIGWDEALDQAGAALAATQPGRVFFYSSGRSSNEAAFLMQLVARAYGTANIHNCSFYCHAASGVALDSVFGSATASVTLDDLAQAELAVVVGANPASNHPRLITQLVEQKRRGGKVLVINPVKELGLVRFRVPSDARSMLFGSEIADLYLQPHAGGDVAVFAGILKALRQMGAIDRPFIESHTKGFAAVEEMLEATSWAEIVGAGGVPKPEIMEAAAMCAGASRGILLWAMGLTHHANGVDNVTALANVALARGWLGKPGAGLVPIRGHSNVQGVGSVGVTPALKKAFAAKLEDIYGIDIPPEPGQDTYASMEAASRGEIDAAVLLGGNLFASNPDRTWAAEVLRRIPLSVSIATKLNEGHVHGRGQTAVVLPALARDEEAQATTQESMFNFVRLSDGGTPLVPGEMRSEVEIIASLAERILPEGRFDWAALRSHDALRGMIADVVPGYGPIRDIGKTKAEFQVGSRTFHEPRFATADGRAQFHVTALPDLRPAPDEFRLVTLRSEGQFNTVVYDEEDLYRGNARRDVLMLAEADARALGATEGTRLRVSSEAGEMTAVAAIIDIRPGTVAMYYPEANVLVPRRLDPRSKTPAFKSVLVRVRKAEA